MSTSTNTTARATAQLVSALQGFLAINALPDPATATLDVKTATLAIQPDVAAHQDPVAVISTLLLWTRGLSAVTARWWRPSQNDLHITIAGRLSGGVQVRVYKGLPYDTVREWVLLDGDHAEGVSLDELAWLIGQLHTTRPAAL
jgi:hypothetical protein